MALMETTSTMIFTDCSSTSSTARLLHFTNTKVQKSPNSICRIRRSIPLRFGISNPKFPRTIITHCSSSSVSAVQVNNQTSATVIDGKRVAKDIREEVAVEISKMKDEIGIVPGLAVILVGDRKDSATYVRNKKKACDTVGITSYEVCLAEDSTEEEVVNHISKFNNDPNVHGILVQLPLPSREDATVSIVHSRTKNPEEITRQADIIIAAVGQPNMVRGSWVKRFD